MNSLVIVSVTGLLFWAGYFFFARKITAVFAPDKDRQTPAKARYDGIDYVPAKHWTILFGHHFSSIAGAAPIIGPVLAVSIWGWAPALLWVVLGSIFAGGVHDYCSLMISVRHGGRSVADISGDTISRSAKLIFLSFAWITLILVISVFTHLCAKTLVLSPEIVLPSIGLVPLSMLMGFLLYSKRFFNRYNQAGVTLLGLAALAALMVLGFKMPLSLGLSEPVHAWSVILLIYAYFASIMPVQILLQPRDYLSAFLLLAGLFFGYIGLITRAPNIAFPAFTGFKACTTNMLWPVLFVTVACGAISGFHSLVASGTTSKQLDNEVNAKKIGYGGMIAEGVLAVLALLIVATVYSRSADLSSVVNGPGGPVHAFGVAYGRMTERFLGSYGSAFAVLILNAFIFTTLDTATRIARYLTQELFHLDNRYLATLLVVALSGWLGISGEWNSIWPVFGAANQLIAAFTLIAVTSYLLYLKKPVVYTMAPAVFMLITSAVALFLKIIEYFKSGNILLAFIALILLSLAFVVFYEAAAVWAGNYRRRHNVIA
ncbi:MAG: carbon starvation protein A [Candidatus Omnitrophota bacterium]|jgi:carbon starvation protein